MKSTQLLQQLTGGDRRSIGRSNAVVAEVLARPEKFSSLFDGFFVDDPVVRARVADAVEKITALHPEYLRSYKAKLIGVLARSEQQEIRWHLAQMLPRLRWSPREQTQVLAILQDYLRDSSSLVKTCAMQGMADLAQQTPALRSTVTRQIEALTACGTPAMRARGRKLLATLSRSPLPDQPRHS